jgi:hypothetical protein
VWRSQPATGADRLPAQGPVALIIRGEFPKPIKLNDAGRAKEWLESEIVQWQQQRIAKRDAN